MNKAILALGVVLVALLALGSQARADGAMHNCPDDGKWAISVWTGGTTDAGEALGTCGNIEVAYALTPTGVWERYIPGAPEVNNMGPLDKYDGVFALGGPAVPVAEPETNVSLYGTLDGCTINGLALSTRALGDGTYYAKSGLHMEPPPTIDGTSATFVVQNMAPLVEVCLYCGDELLVCVDVPDAKGDAHIYTIEVVVTGDEYELLPRDHEYMQFYVGLGPDGEPRYARLGYGGKIPFNPTCPVRWEWHEDTGPICPGHPDAVFEARLCLPGESPVPGETYCLWRE